MSLNELFLVVTEKCNSRCISCNYWKKRKPESLNISDVLIFLDKLFASHRIDTVYITGGEPLMYDSLLELLQFLGENKKKVVLVTNGLLLEKRLTEIEPYISSYCISCDHYTDEGLLEIRGIKKGITSILELLKVVKKPVVFLVVIQRLNILVLENIYLFARKVGIEGIHFNVLAQTVLGSEGIDCPESNWPKLEQMDILCSQLTRILEKERSLEKKFLLTKNNTLLEYVEYFQRKISKRKCNIPLRTIIIESNGEIKNCFYLPKIIGTIKDNDIEKNKYFQASLTASKICNKCKQFMG